MPYPIFFNCIFGKGRGPRIYKALNTKYIKVNNQIEHGKNIVHQKRYMRVK